AAAGGEQRLVPFGIPDKANRGTSREVAPGFRGKHYVTCWDTSALLSALSIHKPHVVKIDVEGAERSIIESLTSKMKDCWPDHIIFEYLPNSFVYGDNPGGIVNYLAKIGYELRDITGSPYRSDQPLPENNIWASLA